MEAEALNVLGIADGVKQLSNVDSALLNTKDIKVRPKKLAPEFQTTFKTVMKMEDDKEQAKKQKEKAQYAYSTPAVSSSARDHKQLSSLDASALRTREEEDHPRPHPKTPDPITPDQPTHSEDPNYTPTSTDSGESKDEEYTKVLISRFLSDSMAKEWFRCSTLRDVLIFYRDS